MAENGTLDVKQHPEIPTVPVLMLDAATGEKMAALRLAGVPLPGDFIDHRGRLYLCTQRRWNGNVTPGQFAAVIAANQTAGPPRLVGIAGETPT